MNAHHNTALQQIGGVITGEEDFIANLANTAAILKGLPGYFWVGFYLVKGNQLVLGPFQGPVACTRIGRGKGVCGAAWSQNVTLMVPDVHAFPGHIACNAASTSELVVPLRNSKGDVIGVLDADSDLPDHFKEDDRFLLEAVAQLLTVPANVTV